MNSAGTLSSSTLTYLPGSMPSISCLAASSSAPSASSRRSRSRLRCASADSSRPTPRSSCVRLLSYSASKFCFVRSLSLARSSSSDPSLLPSPGSPGPFCAASASNFSPVSRSSKSPYTASESSRSEPAPSPAPASPWPVANLLVRSSLQASRSWSHSVAQECSFEQSRFASFSPAVEIFRKSSPSASSSEPDPPVPAAFSGPSLPAPYTSRARLLPSWTLRAPARPGETPVRVDIPLPPSAPASSSSDDTEADMSSSGPSSLPYSELSSLSFTPSLSSPSRLSSLSPSPDCPLCPSSKCTCLPPLAVRSSTSTGAPLSDISRNSRAFIRSSMPSLTL
mmetsp:Transcript_10256/g.31336  ORF Transcript_10256/g.31336 Transcript_10256/m.31336 type:complete len:338 (+) Transcript_10256:1541-2554(+)